MSEVHTALLKTKELRPAPILRDGVVAGALAAIAVAGVYLVHDWIAGRPLETPALLHALVLGQGDAAFSGEIGLAGLAVTTALHVSVWLVVGVVSSLLVAAADAWPRVWVGVFALISFVFLSLLHVAGALDVEGLPQLWIGVVVGAGAMAGLLGARHPGVLKQLERSALLDSTREDLGMVVADEYAARDRYLWVASSPLASEGGAAELFERAAARREARIRSLYELFDQLDLEMPSHAQADERTHTGTLADELRRAVERESATIALHDRLLASVDVHSVREAILRLQAETRDVDLPAFETVAL